MYVVTHNDQVLLGPIIWNARMFNSVIEDDTEIITNILPSDQLRVPLDLGDGLMIREHREERPALNPKTQYHNGPFWTFTPTIGTASYVVVDKPIDLVRQELKAVAATARWNKEEAGTKATIQGTEVTVDTKRGSRDIFVQQYLLLPEGGTTNWKFPEGWLTLTNADLGACVAAGVAHVQAAFDWEAGIVAQIDAAQTLSELDAIEIVAQASVNLGVV